MFTKIDHMLGQNVSLIKLQMTAIKQNIFYDNINKLKVNNEKASTEVLKLLEK